MAGLLVVNLINKLNNITQTEIDERISRDRNFQRKYDARSTLGDIVEARKDGIGLCGKEPSIFALIIVPSISFKDAWDYVDYRYEEIIYKTDMPKEAYAERHAMEVYKYEPTVTKEYKVPTNIPELGNVIIDIDWVTLTGTIDEIDRYQKYYLDMSKIILDDKKEAVLTEMQFIDALGEK